MKNKSIHIMQRRQPLWLVRAMTALYCKQIHRGSQLCPHCAALIEFEIERAKQCDEKQVKMQCCECNRQCYPDAKRLEINHIVRWAESKMRWKKLLLFVHHYCHHTVERLSKKTKKS